MDIHKFPSLTGLVDLYCERTVDGLLAEPWNLFSNIIFFIAFIVGRKTIAGQSERFLVVLNYFILAIAIGSSLFHAYARFWALFLDVAPISVFMVLYVIAYLHYVSEFSRQRIILYTSVFVVFTASLRVIKLAELNHSEFYFAPLIAVVLMTIDRYRQHDRVAPIFCVASSLLACAIFFRIIDAHICKYFPIGTHFMWHICNGFCLMYAMKGLTKILARR